MIPWFYITSFSRVFSSLLIKLYLLVIVSFPLLSSGLKATMLWALLGILSIITRIKIISLPVGLNVTFWVQQ